MIRNVGIRAEAPTFWVAAALQRGPVGRDRYRRKGEARRRRRSSLLGRSPRFASGERVHPVQHSHVKRPQGLPVTPPLSGSLSGRGGRKEGALIFYSPYHRK